MHLGLLRSEQPPEEEIEIPAADIWLKAAEWVNFWVELVQVTEDDKLKQHLTLVGFDSHKPLKEISFKMTNNWPKNKEIDYIRYI